ncbi:MAG: EAL domain-containing protein [Clostridia bacterium]|nr:EAL domain-containing protein [Clostridia bacterium]
MLKDFIGMESFYKSALISAVLLCVVLIVVCAFLGKKLKNIEIKSKIKEMMDYETGIGNLNYFKHNFSHSISDYSRNFYYVAYIVINSNYLQLYQSDSTFTDVVNNAAAILSKSVKHNEFVARISETGFAFAFREMDVSDAKKRINELMEELSGLIVSDENNKSVFYTVVYNLDAQDDNCELLLFNLRRNCSRIFGTENQVLFCDSHSIHSVLEEKKTIDSVISGLENNEFKLYLQFSVDNKTKKIVSAEALSRWIHPEQGLLPPVKYIGVLSKCGLISELDYYMFEMVCKQLEKWSRTEYNSISLSCNFTRITISEDDFIDKLVNICDKYTFDKSRLIIEITEDAIEKNHKKAMNNISECKKLGFCIALDDLGSGYTSLENLCDYPIDIVKIDRDILLKTIEPKGRKLFRGMIALAHSLNLKVVCEGVETLEHNEFVTGTDCDYLQGWYYAKAIPVEGSEEFIDNYNP